MKSDEVLIRALTADDLPSLAAFRCSTGAPWEEVVEKQIRGLAARMFPVSDRPHHSNKEVALHRGAAEWVNATRRD